MGNWPRPNLESQIGFSSVAQPIGYVAPYPGTKIVDYFGKEILSHQNPYDFEVGSEPASARCL